MMQLATHPLEVEVPTDTGSNIPKINKLGNLYAWLVAITNEMQIRKGIYYSTVH